MSYGILGSEVSTKKLIAKSVSSSVHKLNPGQRGSGKYIRNGLVVV